MIAIVGNCPSTGSSFLADLLDSTDSSACGEELNLFSNKHLYDFPKFQKNLKISSASSGIHRIRNRVNFHHLHMYDLTNATLSEMVTNSKDIYDFINTLSHKYLRYRNKSANGILFEKTPENINCIAEFLETFDDSYFIHITRNPLYIYPSLLKRKFPKYVSLTSWLFDVAKYLKYKNNDRIISIKYEDLITNPYAIAKTIIEKVSKITDISEAAIKSQYENNSYRKEFTPRIKTWGVNQYGVITNANKKAIEKPLLEDLAGLLNVKIRSTYANLFGLEEVSFIDALKEFGYYEDVLKHLEPYKKISSYPQKTFADTFRLFYKWEEDCRKGDCRLSDLNNYLNPIERI